MKIDNSVENWMKEWVSLVNKTTPQEDFWIETPFGDIKNPKVISTENFKDNELTITITIQYDDWNKKDK